MDIRGFPMVEVEDFRISLEAPLASSPEFRNPQMAILRGPYTFESGFHVPFTRSDVEEALNDYAPTRAALDPLASIGSTLFMALFSGELGQGFWGKLAEGQANDGCLRLRIGTRLERWQNLPLELLYHPSPNGLLSP